MTHVPDVPDVKEEPVLFGSDSHVLGILTRPGSPRRDLPAVMFLNAGVIHRVGPHRLHVSMARRLAADGFTTFRVDLSGIGDSPLQGELTFWEQAVVDVRAAMDKIGDLAGVRQFVLFGLCSGADNGFATALADERVVGLVLLDPYTYVTLRSRARKLLRRVRELGSVRRIAEWGYKVALRHLRARFAQAGDDLAAPEQSGREPPPAPVFGARLETLLARNVRILVCYSGALEEGYNHPDQLFELFPRLRGRLDRSYFPEANHQFTEIASRRLLVATVRDWLERRYA
jgi:dienelactone hydrolase